MNRAQASVLITGIGVSSAFGTTPEEFWQGLMNNKDAVKMTGRFKGLRLGDMPAAEILHYAGIESCEERILTMGADAICSALKDWGGTLEDFPRIALIIGSGLGLTDQLYYKAEEKGCESYLSQLADKLASSVGLNCESIYIANACSAGSQAISYAMDLMDLDFFDLIICGGIDILSQTAYGGFLRLNAIDRKGCRPFDHERKGIMVGEGAVFFVLQKLLKTDKTKRKPYCELAASSITSDSFHVVQMRANGAEIVRAMDEALFSSKLDKSEVDLIVAHGTGTILNDKTEAKIIKSYFESGLSKLKVTAPKGAIGHTGGASGAFGVLTAVESIVTGIIPPVCNTTNADPDCDIPLVLDVPLKYPVRVAVVNSFAFGGTNVIIICKKYDMEESGW